MVNKLKELGYLLLTLTPFLLLTNAYFLIDPPIWPDEPVFFEMSQNLVKTSKLFTNIYGGGNNLVAETALGYPPLYFALQGFWTLSFGHTIETIRLLSFFLAIGVLITFYYLVKELFHNKLLAFTGALLLSLNIFFLRASRLGRMEILALFLIILTLLCLILFIKKGKLKFLLTAGIFAGLSAITHPLGFMALAIGGAGVIIHKSAIKQKVFNTFLFAIPVMLFVCLWIFTSGNNPLTYLQTYQVHMQDKAPKSAYLFSLFNRSFTWWSFFVSEFLIFLLFIFSCIKNMNRQKLFIGVALIISFVFAILGKEGGYMLYFQPFVILALLYIYQYFQKNQLALWKVIIFIFAFFFIFDSLKIQFLENDNLMINSSAYVRNYNQYAEQILNEIPQNNKFKIFIAAVPDPYFVLTKNPDLTFVEAADPFFPIADNDYKKILDSCDYLFVTWFPHKYLSDYVERNALEKKLVGQNRGYTGVLIKLKPLEARR